MEQLDVNAGHETTIRDGVTKRVIRVRRASDSDASQGCQDDMVALGDADVPQEAATPEEEGSEAVEALEIADYGDDLLAAAAEAASPAADEDAEGEDGHISPMSGEEEKRSAAQVASANEGPIPRREAPETPQPSKLWWQFWRR
ncbi:hypothetical protein CMK11_08545 [Candidatus Poribacteria bacterium]|jgi:hypothetical protein|nr:hypothetical protein [Candidatus Poribacteria bacterium]